VTDAYAYDPFGKPANSSGTTPNSFKYVGRYGVMDEGNNLFYIRARYYESNLGRFVSKDPMMGKDGDVQSLNRYAYALNSPIRLIDISGFSALEVVGTRSSNGTSDGLTSHELLIGDFATKRARAERIQQFLNELVAAQSAQYALEAKVKILESIYEALSGLVSIGVGDLGGGVASLLRLSGTLAGETGDQALGATFTTLGDVVDIGSSIVGFVDQIEAAGLILTATKDSGIIFGNILKSSIVRGAGALYNEAISPSNLIEPFANIASNFKPLQIVADKIVNWLPPW
jgi:RHS repeat-associated protein